MPLPPHKHRYLVVGSGTNVVYFECDHCSRVMLVNRLTQKYLVLGGNGSIFHTAPTWKRLPQQPKETTHVEH